MWNPVVKLSSIKCRSKNYTPRNVRQHCNKIIHCGNNIQANSIPQAMQKVAKSLLLCYIRKRFLGTTFQNT